MPPVEDQETNTGVTTANADGDATEQSSEQPKQSGAQDSLPGGESGKPAGSSDGAPAGAAAAEKPKSALDAVLKVMGKAPATKPDAEKKKEGDPATAPVDEKEHQAAGEGEKEWITREDYAKLPPVVRRRIGKLTEQRNEARDQAKAFEPKAKTYDDLFTYCTGHGLSAEDFSFGLELMALVKSDPAQAWERLQPVLRDLQAHVGEILPNDLAKEVEDGKLSEDRAKELARARRESDRLRKQGAQRNEEQQRADGERQLRDNHTKVTNAIKGWEEQWAKTDPDYKRKSGRVFERMMLLMQGKDITPASAVEYAEQAKQDVEGWIKEILPPKREVKPGPTGGAGGSSRKQPTSALEAARLAVAETRAA